MIVKELRQYIRQMLLTEAMKMPSDLSDSMYVLIEDTFKGYFEITIIDYAEPYPQDGEIAQLQVKKSRLPCDNAWEIVGAGAQIDGFGPLVYDIAMEYVGSEGLMCDRSSVSEEAARVWEYYLNSRSDVRAVQLDHHNKPFVTPSDKSDDCDGYYTLARHTDRDLAVGFNPNNSDHRNKWMTHWSTKKFIKTSGTPIIDELRELKLLYYDREDVGQFYA